MGHHDSRTQWANLDTRDRRGYLADTGLTSGPGPEAGEVKGWGDSATKMGRSTTGAPSVTRFDADGPYEADTIRIRSKKAAP